jgi:hypothetical protein
MQDSDATRREKESRSRNAPTRGRHHPRKRVIQYAAAYRLKHWRLRILDRPIKPGDDHRGLALDVRSALPLAASDDNTTMTSHMNIVPSP